MNANPNTVAASPVALPAAGTPSLATAHITVLPSADLLRGQKEVRIEHNGSEYRLQTTRQGKLILTK